MEWADVFSEKVDAGEVEVGQGASGDLIRHAEETLGPLPADYRLFLSKFGFASVGPDEIFGLGADVPSYMNVVDMTLAERRDFPNFPSNAIVIFNDGGGNLYFLNGSTSDTDSPVFVLFHDEPANIQIDSPSFSEWLLARLS